MAATRLGRPWPQSPPGSLSVQPAPALGPRPSRPTFRARHADCRRRRQRVWQVDLLRVPAGVSRPTEGLITQRPRQVGYVPERLPARLQMTGRQYLAHMGQLRRLDTSYAALRSEDLAARLSLSPGMDVPVRSLSKGNSQKWSWPRLSWLPWASSWTNLGAVSTRPLRRGCARK